MIPTAITATEPLPYGTPELRPRPTALDLGLLIIRVGVGAAFVVHGWPKLIGGPHFWQQIGGAMGNFGIHSAPTAWGFMAAIAEFGGGLLLALGMFTRLAALALVVQMAVAINFHLHAPAPEMRAFQTGWSHAMEDGVVFLGLLFTGAGAFSVDRALFRRNLLGRRVVRTTTTTTTARPVV